jgi:hypothetical protein
MVTANEFETLCCHICQHAFPTLERSWLASPTGGGLGIWVHETCISGRAVVFLADVPLEFQPLPTEVPS